MYLSSGGKGAIRKEGFVFNTVEMPAAPTSSECRDLQGTFLPLGSHLGKAKAVSYILSRNITRKKERKAIVEVVWPPLC